MVEVERAEERAGLEKVTMKALERKDYKKKRVKSYLSLCTLCTLRPKTFFRIFNHFLMIEQCFFVVVVVCVEGETILL